MQDTQGLVRYGSPLAGLILLLVIYLLSGGFDGAPTAQRAQAPLLPALAADVTQTSVSGISSGAYMAGQFQLAHADEVKGAAIIAGGPYGCAESVFGNAMMNAAKAINGCMLNAMAMWGVPNPSLLADRAEHLSQDGRIAPLDKIRAARIYLFSGRQDRIVVPAIVNAAADFYRRLGVPDDQLMVVADYPAGHAFVTEHSGSACSISDKPYVVDCDYDQAGALLQHIYGRLEPPAMTVTGTFSDFDQTPFVAGMRDHSLADAGEVYVPQSCAGNAGCRVHIAFHGCAQNRDAVGDMFVKRTGFARWADTNRLIVLFPQTVVTPMTPQACWDWWGYTGRDYLTKSAPQITAVYGMLQQLGRPRPSS